MKSIWKSAVLSLAAGLLVVFAGFRFHSAAHQQKGLPQGLETVRQTLAANGGEDGLRQRLAELENLEQELRQRRLARRGNAAAFSQRLDRAFAELELRTTASSDWRLLADYTTEQGAAFERRFDGVGSFGALLDALATIESWPDRPVVRSLSIEALDDGRGEVRFQLVIAALRQLPTAETEEL